VLLDGAPVRSCLLFAVAVDGQEVTTVEGLAKGRRDGPIQRAFEAVTDFSAGSAPPAS
jgi:carbon-monoxide dehydrogenase small subunit